MMPQFESTTEWVTERQPGLPGAPRMVTCHTLIVGGVLCRWWGENEPRGAAPLADLARVIAENEAHPERRGTDSVTTCSGCGRVYARKRKPQAGRNNYCEDCVDHKVPGRDRQRRYALRKRGTA